jgi:hypothetical protein
LIAGIDLDLERTSLYCYLILNSLPEVARRAVSTMDIKNKTYQYQSEFARRFYGQGVEAGIARGIEQGKEQGRVDMQLQLLKNRLRRSLYGFSKHSLEGECCRTGQNRRESSNSPYAERCFGSALTELIVIYVRRFVPDIGEVRSGGALAGGHMSVAASVKQQRMMRLDAGV